ncbi:MAG: hypothetical protein ACRC7N_11190, partial [Clostridium sp.]
DKVGNLLSKEETRANVIISDDNKFTNQNSSNEYSYNELGLVKTEYIKKLSDNNNVIYEYKEYNYDQLGRSKTEAVGVDFVKKGEKPKKMLQKKNEYYSNGKLKSELYEVNDKKQGRKIEYDYDIEGNKNSEKLTVDEGTVINKNWSFNYEKYKTTPGVLYTITETLPVDKSDLGTSESDVSGVTSIIRLKEFNLNSELISEETYENEIVNNNKNSRKKELTYDQMGNVNSEKISTNTGAGYIVQESISKEYNTSNKIIKEIGKTGVDTYFNYDSNLNLISKSTSGDTINYGYDRQGRVIWEENSVDKAYLRTAVSQRYNAKPSSPDYLAIYDLNSDGVIDIFDLVTVERKTINKTNYYYYIKDNLIVKEKEFIDEKSGKLQKEVISAHSYNKDGRVIKEVDGEQYSKSTGDSITSRFNNAVGTKYQYDFQGELTSIKYSDEEIKYGYDNTQVVIDNVKTGRVLVEQRNLGSIRYKLNIFDDVADTEVVENGTTKVIESKEFDYVGNVKSIKDGNGNISQYTYNNLGLVKTETMTGDSSIAENTIVYRYNPF